MRINTFLLLMTIGLLGPSIGQNTEDNYYRGSSLKRFLYGHFFADNSASEQTRVPNFQEGTVYHYSYDAQVESGQSIVDESGTPTPTSDNGQQAVTRIQSQLKVYFASPRRAQLCMTENRFGQLNEQMKQTDSQQCCEPLNIFEPKQIPEEMRQKLEMCCQFEYVDGVIARVQFDKQDETWSKNIKRGVLNMIQMNLRQQNNPQKEEMAQTNAMNAEENEATQTRDQLAHSFTIPEVTVEGDCQTSYTINTANPSKQCTKNDNKQQQMPCSFNVTKSINFKQCTRIGDLSAGFQTEQPQAHCAQCRMDWYKQQGNQQQSATAEHPCAKCDPKVVKEQTLDRQTVMRATLKCGNEQQMSDGKQQQNCPNCCQIDSSEMRSMYVYKNTKTESGPYGSAMRTEVCAKLQLRSTQSMQQQIPTQTADNDESLVYSSQWETDSQRFYMFGDEEFTDPRSSPFSSVPKVEQAGQALRALVESTSDHHHGIDTKQTLQLSRLIEMLRMCSYQDLKQIEQNARQYHQQQQQTAQQILVDAIAICGTRNCVVRLADIIKNKEVSSHKAAYTIRQLIELPVPSNSIVNEVQKLCQSEQVKNDPIVKQSAWFTFGALVNELCQKNNQQQQTPDSSQAMKEQCKNDKKEQYKQVLVEQYEKAKTLQEKLNALISLGNAGIDTSTPQLEQIIKDTNEHPLVRVKAIDALRRQSTQQPKTVQQIILPIYLNNQEEPNVRIVALEILMRTQPESSVIDKIIYTMSQEPNKRVQSYTYQTMKLVAKSRNPADRQTSKHVKNSMQSANIDEQQLWNSAKWQVPVYSPEHEEGIFVTLATEYSQRSWMPSLNYLKIDSFFKEQSNVNDLLFYVMKYKQLYGDEQNQRRNRNHRASAIRGYGRDTMYNNENSQQLKEMYQALGIKSRRAYGGYGFGGFGHSRSALNDQQNQQQEYLVNNINVLCMRIGDVDHSCYEINNYGLNQTNQQHMPQAPPMFTELIQSMQTGRKPSLARMFSELEQLQNVHQYTIASQKEKEAVVPTSIGLPLGIVNAVPMILHVNVGVNLQKDPQTRSTKVHVNGRLMGGMAHMQKMRIWNPFFVSGVKSIRSIEINVPVQMDISANTETTNNEKQSLILNVKLPNEKTRLFGAHSHPYVYTADINPKTNLVIEPRQVKTIRNPKLDRLQNQMNILIGENNLGIPVNVHAHYHWPSSVTNFEQICKMLMSTENAIHVTYQPKNEESPNNVVFKMNMESFEPFNQPLKLKMNDFYLNKFENNDDEENNNEDYSFARRQQKMNDFLSNYQNQQEQQKHYKHSLEMSVQTVGGSKEFKFSTELQANCEEQMKICQLKMLAQKRLNNDEKSKWILNGQAEMVMPDNVDYDEDYDNKNNNYVCKANCLWGNENELNKQQINIRIIGEKLENTFMSQFKLNNKEQQKRRRNNKNYEMKLKRRTSFINKFNCEAEYLNLKPITRNVFERALELLKSKYFWNTKTELSNKNRKENSSNGKTYLNAVIDSITQKHANITVKTPEQMVRFQQIELPIQMSPFPLMMRQQQNAQNIQSFAQLLSQQEVNSRAECSVDGQSVETFDNREFNAPLSTDCYSVLTKDCEASVSGVPQFVVLMKAIEKGSKNSQKKLKLLTPDLTIECQTADITSINSPIKCKINGQYNDTSSLIKYTDTTKKDLTINLDQISVRFNSYKTWIKISSELINTQCGLCGHYDYANNDENEFLMPNNEIASNLAEFHRSYSLSSSYDNDDKLCNSQVLDKFYEENSNKFGYNLNNNNYEMNEREDEGREENNLKYQSWDEERFDGNYDQNKENKYFYNERPEEEREWEDNNDNENENNNEQGQQRQLATMAARNMRRSLKPILKTKIIEMENEICFSKQPIKQCPMGTYPTGWEYNNNNNEKYNNNNEEQMIDQQEDQQQQNEQNQSNNNEHFETKNAHFICMSRSDAEARHLLNQINYYGNKQLNLNSYKQHSMTENIKEPKSCRRL